METKEEILREAADNYVSNHADGEVRRMYGHHLRSFKDGWNGHESYSQQSTKHLQDRIVELTKVLDTCDKTFELLNQIVFNLKAAADGDNLKDMVEAVDIDFPLIQAKIKDTLLNTKS